MASGIYTIYNKSTNKYYVGYADDLSRRLKQHLYELKRNEHCNYRLQEDFHRFGESSFIFEPLEECPVNLMSSQEHYWCNMLDSHLNGYNIRPTHPEGKQYHSQESRNKIRVRSNQPDNKARIREIQKLAVEKNRGSKRSLETRLKMNRHGENKLIDIYDKSGNLINTCYLQSEASKITGVKRSAISNNLVGITKSTKLYTFKYREV